jgi:Ca-activated chloride channel family protein
LRAGSVNRVFLLSDGLANKGLVHPRDFRALLNRSDMRGIPVTTLGLGLNYNEDLMQAIAEDSGGAYYYIESPVQIASVFQRELSSLFKTVASDISLQFNAGPAVRSVQVFGYPSKSNANATKVELSSLFAGEIRTIVLRLDLKKHHVGKVDLGDIRLSYKNVADGGKVTMNNPVTVTATKDDDVILKAANKDTIVIAKLAEAEASQRKALKYVQKGDWKRAKQEIASAAADIRKTNSRFNDARLNTKLEALRVEEKMVEKSANVPQATASKQFMKRSKQRLYQAYQGKRGGFSYKPGDSGDHVRQLQIALAKVGYYKGPKNGRYTNQLRNAVRSYQKDQKLKVDGVAGPMTLHRLKIY